ncbi:MAG: hypothetical protein HQK75_06015 [Candidatus Magnetomorum sp.]|nr:hypothetical protein [Candidatus Magnetomorum sp.]
MKHIYILLFVHCFFVLPVLGAQLQINSQTAKLGDTVIFTVFIHNAPDPVDAFGFEIVYDPSVIIFQSGATQRGALISNGFQFFRANNVSIGRIRIGGLESGDQHIVQGATGTLVMIPFNVIGENSTSVSLENLKDDFKTWTIQNGQLIVQTDETSTEETSDPNDMIVQTDETSTEETSDLNDTIENQSTVSENQNISSDLIESTESQTDMNVSTVYHNASEDLSIKKSIPELNQMVHSDGTRFKHDAMNESSQNQQYHGKTSIQKSKETMPQINKYIEYQQNDSIQSNPENTRPAVNKTSNVHNVSNDRSDPVDWGTRVSSRISESNDSRTANVHQRISSHTPDILIVLVVLMLIVQLGILAVLCLIYRRGLTLSSKRKGGEKNSASVE